MTRQLNHARSAPHGATGLLTALANWKPFTALVVGDFMLDQHVFGDAERLTADAPVPILHAKRTEQNPGGAANVAMDLVALHARVQVFGVIGDDHDGRLLSGELGKGGIDAQGLIADPSRPTTVKRSLIGLAQHRHPQKMFRVDYESREPIAERVIDELVTRFEAALAGADVVAIEDYGKGVCTPALCRAIIDRCRRAGKEVLVDPACIDDYSRYRGATTVTPNRTEAEVATGLDTHDENDLEHNTRLARTLLEQHDLASVVLTLDRHGALLLESGGAPETVPTVARQVYDVTGAGDMVLAALMAARANGIGWSDAVRFANAAAGLEVEVFGCQPIPFERIHRAILVQARRLFGKTRTLPEAAVEVAAARREGKKIVFTNGCFDILHAGHVRLMQEAAAHGDLLIVGINSDRSVRRLKGPERPIHSEADRAAILGELQSVGLVVIFDEETPMRILETLRPDVIVKGGDYSKDQVVGGEFVESYGGRVQLVDLLQGRSTTSALNKLRAS